MDGYRNKCEFAIGVNPETDKLTVGFKLDPRSGSPEVGPVEHLKHVPSSMKAVVRLLETHLRSTPYKHFNYQSGQGSWVSAIVRVTQKQQTMLIINFVVQEFGGSEVRRVKAGLKAFFEHGDGAKTGPGSLEKLCGTSTISESLQGLQLTISPRAYFCINTHGAELLCDMVAALAGVSPNMALLDICCGTGSIGLSLARRCGAVQGVDILAEAIEDAQENCKVNRVTNATFLAGPAEDLIPAMIGQATHELLVAVVDPPRTGLHMKAIRQLRASRVQRIVYIASDPKSAFKNFVDLSRPESAAFHGDPFMPVLIQPVDLFPHTTHYMTVFLFMRVPQADLLYPHRANMDSYYGLLPPPPPSQEGGAGGAGPAGDPLEAQLTSEQRAWLEQMVNTYGAQFQRAQWVATMAKNNAEAAAPRPPSPQIPPMPAFPVAPTNPDPEAYAKYKAEYDEYSAWYAQYGLLYAAKQEKSKAQAGQVTASGAEQGKLPDPNQVPAGTDPVAWRKYCNDTREYYAQYKQQPQLDTAAVTEVLRGETYHHRLAA